MISGSTGPILTKVSRYVRYLIVFSGGSRDIYLFIMKSYTKYKIDRKTETESVKKKERKKKQHIQSG